MPAVHGLGMQDCQTTDEDGRGTASNYSTDPYSWLVLQSPTSATHFGSRPNSWSEPGTPALPPWAALPHELINFLDTETTSSVVRLSFNFSFNLASRHHEPRNTTFFYSCPSSASSSASDLSVESAMTVATTTGSGPAHQSPASTATASSSSFGRLFGRLDKSSFEVDSEYERGHHQHMRYYLELTELYHMQQRELLQAAVSARTSPPVPPRRSSVDFSWQYHHHQRTASRTATNNGNSGLEGPRAWNSRRRASRSVALSNGLLHGLPTPVPTREEFESLPPAIQRKYFSTLERLRFAQIPFSGQPDGLANTDLDDLALPTRDLSRRRSRQSRIALDRFGSYRRSSRRSRISSLDSAFYANLPDKIKRRHLTDEEQFIVARHRQSVILDPADEAIYRIGRRASRVLSPDELALSFLSSENMDHQGSSKPEPEGAISTADSFYDSFRWLEEDDDLDLRLALDDYHENIPEEVPVPAKQRRPSFRRHLSLSKIPFGRPSMSSSRPGTKDTSVGTPTSPQPSALGPAMNPSGHVRRKSRTLSLITAKQTPEDGGGITAIDPAATHYQDPEARLKLRVYLASPQKFDEAIEFGFPSTDVLSAKPKEAKAPKRIEIGRTLSEDSDRLRTFLSDDKSSIYSEAGDDASIPDPDSPKTPNPGERPRIAPLRLGGEPSSMRKISTDYAQAPASSREMTLRMTLTRPDLRANEDQIYGWQRGGLPGRRSLSSAARDEPMMATQYLSDGNPKESMERHFASLDHWAAQPEKGVVKRFWNKVRKGPGHYDA